LAASFTRLWGYSIYLAAAIKFVSVVARFKKSRPTAQQKAVSIAEAFFNPNENFQDAAMF